MVLFEGGGRGRRSVWMVIVAGNREEESSARVSRHRRLSLGLSEACKCRQLGRSKLGAHQEEEEQAEQARCCAGWGSEAAAAAAACL